MKTEPIKLYSFTQSITALEAFVANFSAKVNEIKEDLPVFTLNTGDETYYFEKKFKPKSDSKKFREKDLNNIVPRIVLDFNDSPNFDQEQNTNSYVPYIYVFNNRIYKCRSRRLAYTLNISTNIVTSNFIKALEYFDMISSMVSTDKVLTYEFLGNTFESNYRVSGLEFEKNSIEAGSATRNFIVKVTLEYVIQLWCPNYPTIRDITDEINGTDNTDANQYKFQIIPTDPDGTQTPKEINIPEVDCGCYETDVNP